MNKAFIGVDVEGDFIDGSLAVPDGAAVIDPIIDLFAKYDVIVLTRDWHPEDHISFDDPPRFEDKSWPKHCVQGTPGAEIDPRLLDAAIETGKPVLLVHKGVDKDTEQYSGIEGTVVDCWNIAHAHVEEDFKSGKVNLVYALNILRVNEVGVGGLALDYCVFHTAKDVAAAGWPTKVYIHATRPVAYQSGIDAAIRLAQMDNVRVVR